jgi:drug/metabolite transporter (DMT)-like permease
MRSQNKAYLYAGLSILFWSTVASAFKLTLKSLTTVEMLVISALVSTGVLFVILLLKKKLPELKKLTRQDYALSFLMGLLSPFLYYLVVFKAYSLLPAQQAQPLNLIWGIVIVIFSIPVLGQKLRPATFLSILISFAGVIIISTEGHFSLLKIRSPLGVGLALGSSVLWSLYWVINTRDKRDPLIRLFLNFGFGSVMVLIFFLLFHPLRIPPLAAIGGAVYIGFFEMGLSFYFWLMALKLSETTARVSILIYIMPFISLVFIHWLVGEEILFASFAGLVMIVAGIILEQLSGIKKIRGSR